MAPQIEKYNKKGGQVNYYSPKGISWFFLNRLVGWFNANTFSCFFTEVHEEVKR